MAYKAITDIKVDKDKVIKEGTVINKPSKELIASGALVEIKKEKPASKEK